MKAMGDYHLILTKMGAKDEGGGTEDGAEMLILVQGGREGCVDTMISLQWDIREWEVSSDGRKVKVISVIRLRRKIN